MAGDHPPLPVELPHTRVPDLRRRRGRLLPRSRPRVPVVPRDPARPPPTAHGLTSTASVNIHPQTASLNFQTAPAGPPAHRRHVRAAGDPVHADRDRRLAQLRPGALARRARSRTSRTSLPGPTAAPRTTTSSRPRALRLHGDLRDARRPLGIAVTPSPEPVGAGATLTYTLNVANAGPSQANSVSLTDSLPAGVAFVSAPGRAGPARGPGRSPARSPRLGIARPARSRSA